MKDLRSIILLTTIMLIASLSSVSAQRRDEKTSSARAAYGATPDAPPIKHKTKKKHKAHKNKQAKASRDKSPAYRRRSNWAG